MPPSAATTSNNFPNHLSLLLLPIHPPSLLQLFSSIPLVLQFACFLTLQLLVLEPQYLDYRTCYTVGHAARRMEASAKFPPVTTTCTTATTCGQLIINLNLT
jgi:hypothetical protein